MKESIYFTAMLVCCSLAVTLTLLFSRVFFSQLTPGESRAVVMNAPTIVYPQQATIVQQDGRPLEQAR